MRSSPHDSGMRSTIGKGSRIKNKVIIHVDRHSFVLRTYVEEETDQRALPRKIFELRSKVGRAGYFERKACQVAQRIREAEETRLHGSDGIDGTEEKSALSDSPGHDNGSLRFVADFAALREGLDVAERPREELVARERLEHTSATEERPERGRKR